MFKTSLLKLLLATFFLVLAGCESADDTPDTNPTPKPTAVILHQFGQQPEALGGDFEVAKGTQVTFTVNVTAAAGRTIAKYQWPSPLPAGVSAVGEINPDSNSLTVTFDSVGEYTLSLTVVDSSAVASNPAQVTVTVIESNNTNLPPSVVILHDEGKGGTPSSNTTQFQINRGASVNFQANVNDPNGDTIAQVQWDFGSLSPTITDPQKEFSVTFATAGNYNVKLSATDSKGASATSATVTIIVNDVTPQAPVSVITHNVGTNNSADITVDSGDTVTFNAQPSGTGYTYLWDFGNAQVISGGNTSAGPIQLKFPTAAVYTITLTVSNNGVADSTPAMVKVTAQDPNANIVYSVNNGASSSGNASIDTGATIAFSASPSNPNYSYQWTFGGAANDASGSGPINVTFSSAGTYNISLTATNANGVADKTPATMTVTVKDPVTTAPDASITYLINGSPGTSDFSVNLGTSVIFGVTPPINTNYTYNWNFGGAAADASGANATVVFSSVGVFVVSLTAVDANNVPDPTPAIVTVSVVDPNVTATFDIVHDNGSGDGNITRTGNINIFAGDSVVYNVSSNLTNTANYSFSWDFDGPGYTLDANGNLKVTYDGSWVTPNTTNGVGTYITSLQVVDTVNAITFDLITLTVNVSAPPVNQPPTASFTHDLGAGINGSSGDLRIAAGSTVQFVGSGTDPEGSNINFSWNLPGATPATANTPNVSAVFGTPGQYSVSLTVTDASGLADPNPPSVMVSVLPAFTALPLLSPTSQTGTNLVYDVSVDNNVDVNVVTPSETWATPMLRYNNLQLPPVIKVARGDHLSVNVTNHLPNDDTTIHWHGLKVDGANDGGPDFPITANGGTLTYNFTVQQAAAPLWFHPHPDMMTGTQVYFGLAGALIVTDTISDNLETTNQLPSADHDIALLIQDRSFDASTTNGHRNLIYQTSMGTAFLGMLGDRILVNDVEMPALHVDNRQYRFRLYNGSNARTYDIALSDGATFTVVGSDGGLLPSPVSTADLMLAPGERAEIVVNFSGHNPGDSLKLVSKSFSGGMMGGGMVGLANGAAFDIMSFEVKHTATDPVTLYSALPNSAEINTRYAAALGITSTPGQPLQTQTTYNERPFVMSVVAGPQFLINGVAYDATITNETITLPANPGGGNDPVTEVWTISNNGGAMMMSMAHPFHAHAIQWQILDRSVNNVVSAPQPMDKGWKDTFRVQPGETVRIMGVFEPGINSGKYMYHCHILEHEDAGMMGIFEVLAQ